MGLRSHSPEGCPDCEAYEESLMTEKKTFEGAVDVDSRHNGWSVQAWESRSFSDCQESFFSKDEWDMEVTFTKKVKPFEIGDFVETYGARGYVIGVWEDFVWVTIGSGAATYTKDEVKHVF
jgi:hypothetical protein